MPHEARKEVLKTLHIQHTGESKTLANARQIYFWPGLTSDVKLMVAACNECLPSQQMGPHIWPPPMGLFFELQQHDVPQKITSL